MQMNKSGIFDGAILKNSRALPSKFLSYLKSSESYYLTELGLSEMKHLQTFLKRLQAKDPTQED